MPKKSVSILSVGDELLQGSVLNSNASSIARMIAERGGSIRQHLVCSDKEAEIHLSLNHLLPFSEVVITTGGTGPTKDDNTIHAVASFLGRDLLFDHKSYEKSSQRLKRLGLPITENDKKTAYFPKGCQIIENHNGASNGCVIEYSQNKYLICLPGPPRECLPMVQEYVLDLLGKLNCLNQEFIHKIQFLGISEGQLDEWISKMSASQCNVGYRWHHPYVELKISSQEGDHDTRLFKQKIRRAFGKFIVSEGDVLAREQLEQFLKDHNIQLNIQTKWLDECISIGDYRFEIKGKGLDAFYKNTEHFGMTSLELKLYLENTCIGQIMISLPSRGQEVIKSAIAYTYFKSQQLIMEAIKKELLTLNSSSLSDALDSLNIEGALPGISPVAFGKTIFGPVYTVKYEAYSERPKTFQNAGNYIDDVPEGHIILIDNEGRTDCTVWGDILTNYSINHRILGTIVHGAIRDIAEIRMLNYPLFSKAIYMRSGKNRVRKTEERGSLKIGNINIHYGDYAFADDNGVLIIPRDRLIEVYKRAVIIQKNEEKIKESVKSGMLLVEARKKYHYDQPWR